VGVCNLGWVFVGRLSRRCDSLHVGVEELLGITRMRNCDAEKTWRSSAGRRDPFTVSVWRKVRRLPRLI